MKIRIIISIIKDINLLLFLNLLFFSLVELLETLCSTLYTTFYFRSFFSTFPLIAYLADTFDIAVYLVFSLVEGLVDDGLVDDSLVDKAAFFLFHFICVWRCLIADNSGIYSFYTVAINLAFVGCP